MKGTTVWLAICSGVFAVSGCSSDTEEMVDIDAGPAVTVNCELFPTTIAANTGLTNDASLCFDTCSVTTDVCPPMREILLFGREPGNSLGRIRAGAFTTILEASQGVFGGLVVSNLGPDTESFVDFRFSNQKYRLSFSYTGDDWTFTNLAELQ